MNNEIAREAASVFPDTGVQDSSRALLNELHRSLREKEVQKEVSNPISAFGNGMLRSLENSVNGASQLANGRDYKPVSIASRPDPKSDLAGYAYMAGEIVGSGLQIVGMARFAPGSRSIVGSVAKNATLGAAYGGLLQPTEGNNLAEERVKNGLSMAAFMGTFEASRLGMLAVGSRYGAADSLARGAVAGGTGGVAFEATNKGLNQEEITAGGLARTLAQGALLGSAMELTGAALVRTDVNRMVNSGYRGASGSPMRQSVDLNIPQGVNNQGLLDAKRAASRFGEIPQGVNNQSLLDAKRTASKFGEIPQGVNNQSLLDAKRFADRTGAAGPGVGRKPSSDFVPAAKM